MLKVDKLFILFGILAALGGMALGEHMGRTSDLTQRVTHVHTLALGWIGAFLFGLCYRAWPMLKGWLAWAHLALHAGGVAAMLSMLFLMFGGAIAYEAAGPVLGLSSFAIMLGVVLFAINFLMRAGRETAAA